MEGSGWGDCEDEGGRSQICAVHVPVFWGGGMGRRVCVCVVGDQPNYTWLIQSNRSGPK